MVSLRQFSGESFDFKTCDNCPNSRECINEIGAFGLRQVVHESLLQEYVDRGLATVDQALAKSEDFKTYDNASNFAELFLASRDCIMTKEETEVHMHNSEQYYRTSLTLDFE